MRIPDSGTVTIPLSDWVSLNDDLTYAHAKIQELSPYQAQAEHWEWEHRRIRRVLCDLGTPNHMSAVEQIAWLAKRAGIATDKQGPP